MSVASECLVQHSAKILQNAKRTSRRSCACPSFSRVRGKAACQKPPPLLSKPDGSLCAAALRASGRPLSSPTPPACTAGRRGFRPPPGRKNRRTNSFVRRFRFKCSHWRGFSAGDIVPGGCVWRRSRLLLDDRGAVGGEGGRGAGHRHAVFKQHAVVPFADVESLLAVGKVDEHQLLVVFPGAGAGKDRRV